MDDLNKKVNKVRNSSLYQEIKLALDVAELICELMQKQDISRDKLAGLIEKNRIFVDFMLDEGSHMDIQTIAKVFYVLGSRIKIELVSLEN